MAGIYLHIPFCKQACHYCNFHFSTSLKYKEDVLEAMRKEIKLQREYLAGDAVKTIYFGGGTPSLLEAAEIHALIDEIGKYHDISQLEEVTLEANPDDLSKEKLADLKETAVDRLSIGIQSFSETDLRYMNRAHNAEEAANCIQNALAAGFDNLSIDLIYGTPTLSQADWEENLATIFKYKIAHISCYALTVEPKTALDHFVRSGKSAAPSEEQAAQQFEHLVGAMKANGYEHYEISNFALPGKYALHNSAYWTGEKYLGIGPSAHSFNGTSRQWNIANNAQYLRQLQADEIPAEVEQLSLVDRYNEYLMTSLRTKWGAQLSRIDQWGTANRKHFLAQAQKFIDEGLMLRAADRFYLSEKGKFLSDGIISDLFVE